MKCVALSPEIDIITPYSYFNCIFSRTSKVKKMEISKLSGESLDVKQSHIDSLKSIFPQAVKDGKVDFKALQLILGDDIATDNERYGLNWAGKMDCSPISARLMKVALPDWKKNADWLTSA